LVIAVHDGVPVYELQLEVVEVAVAWSPFVHTRHGERAALPAVGRDFFPLGITQDHLGLNRVSVLGLRGVSDHAVGAIKISGDS
jgi:hypothetical protein